MISKVSILLLLPSLLWEFFMRVRRFPGKRLVPSSSTRLDHNLYAHLDGNQSNPVAKKKDEEKDEKNGPKRQGKLTGWWIGVSRITSSGPAT